MEEGLFHNPLFVNHISEYAVAVVGHGQQHQEVTRTDPITGEQVQRCPNYGSIPCAAHMLSMQQARQGFDFRGVPASFVCGPDGRPVGEPIVGNPPPQRVIDAVTAALQGIGRRPILGSQIARIERDLFRGDVKLREGKFSEALRLYQGVQENEGAPQFVRRRAEGRVTALRTRAAAAIETARALPATQARRELRELVRNLRDLEEERAAAEAALAGLEGGG